MRRLIPHIDIRAIITVLLFISFYTVTGTCTWTWYRDADADGFGDPYNFVTTACGASAPTGYVSNNIDTNDAVVSSPVWYGTSSQVSTLASTGTQIVFSADSTPYVMLINFNTSKLNVLKSNGSSWTAVGAADFSTSLISNLSPSLAIDGNTPYVSYADNSGTLVVMTYTGTGATGWQTLGSTGTSSVTDFTDIVVFGGVPYATFKSGSSILAMKYLSGSWSAIGGTIGSGSYPQIVVDGSGVPYVTFSDDNYSGNISVRKFNGTTWVDVGSPGFSSGYIDFPEPTIVVDGNNVPYVAYYDGGLNEVVAKKYSSGNWIDLASNAIYANQPTDLSFDVDYWGNPYIAYSDGSYYTVKKVVSNNWVSVGSDPVTTETGSTVSGASISMALTDGGVPYLAFLNVDQVSVLELKDLSSPLPVTLIYFKGEVSNVDEITLTWETAQQEDLSHFVIEYSSDGKNFEFVDQIVASAGSEEKPKRYLYRDHRANNSNYYRLKSVDVDGRFMYSNTIALFLQNSIRNSFSIYPNPSTGDRLLIKFKSDPLPGDFVQIIDMLGNMVFSAPVSEITSDIVFENRLNSGQYIVNYLSGERQLPVHMVVIQ